MFQFSTATCIGQLTELSESNKSVTHPLKKELVTYTTPKQQYTRTDYSSGYAVLSRNLSSRVATKASIVVYALAFLPIILLGESATLDHCFSSLSVISSPTQFTTNTPRSSPPFFKLQMKKSCTQFYGSNGTCVSAMLLNQQLVVLLFLNRYHNTYIRIKFDVRKLQEGIFSKFLVQYTK